MLFGIEFRDEHDKQELVELAQRAKETACDLWEKMAEHMPELRQLQERNGRYRGGFGMGGYSGNIGYRNYGGGNYREFNAYPDFREGYGPSMGGHPVFRENPAYTGGGDRRGY